MVHHDVLVIGSGSGNSLVTPALAQASIGIVEAGTFGGTCLNVGCIPTKMFAHTADIAASARDAARFGVDARVDGVRWADVRDRVFGRIDPISAGGARYRADGDRTALYRGWARFVGPHEVSVSMPAGPVVQVTADHIVIATGSAPVVPEPIAASGVPFHTSETIMRLDDLPRRLVIVGGGFIACEFAHIFEALGSEVTIVTRGEGLLRQLEPDIKAEFNRIAGSRWRILSDTTVTGASPAVDPETGAAGIHLELADGRDVTGDVLLVAVGRRPTTDDLGLDAAGVARHDDGRVIVDDRGESGVPGVWALGDACSPYPLKHVANHEARVVAHNLAVALGRLPGSDWARVDHHAVPAAVFTRPQLAYVGMTPQQARDAGHDVVVSTTHYRDTAYGWALEDATSRCTVVADRASRTLLGAHLMGPHASVLIQPLVQVMAFGQRLDGLARGQYWTHPALAEVVENALLGLGFEE